MELNFHTQNLVSEIQSGAIQIPEGDSFREGVIQLAMTGLQSLGFDKTVKVLESEGGFGANQLLPTELKNFLRSQAFDSCIGFLKLPENSDSFSPEERDFLEYNFWKLKFVVAACLDDVALSIYLIRSELSRFSELYNKDKCLLSNSLLEENKKEYFRINFINPMDQESYEHHIQEIENELLARRAKKSGRQSPDISFEQMMKLAFSYRLLNCKNHSPLERFSYDSLMYHKCKPSPLPTKNSFEISPELELVALCSTSDAYFFAGVSQSGVIVVYEASPDRGEKFVERFRTKSKNQEGKKYLKIDEHNQLLILASQYSIESFELANGEINKFVEKAHLDFISGLALCESKGQIVTASVEGTLSFWSSSLKKEASLPTKRITEFFMAPSSEFLLYLFTERKVVDKISLLDRSLSEAVIVEQQPIISLSFDLSPNIVAVGFSLEFPAVNIWDIQRRQLLRSFGGLQNRPNFFCFGFADQSIFFAQHRCSEIGLWNFGSGLFLKSLKIGGQISSFMLAGREKGQKILTVALEDGRILLFPFTSSV